MDRSPAAAVSGLSNPTDQGLTRFSSSDETASSLAFACASSQLIAALRV
jgi:hypothetical protein